MPRMCFPYQTLSPAHQQSSDEEEGERQSPPLEVSDGEADGLEPGPGLLHGETGRVQHHRSSDRSCIYIYEPCIFLAKVNWPSSHVSEVCVCVCVCVHVHVYAHMRVCGCFSTCTGL